MIRLAINELQAGMVLAENAVNQSEQVILSEHTILTREQILTLQQAQVPFVRIREEFDTDESLAEQLFLDRMILETETMTPDERRKTAQESLGIYVENILSILAGQGDEKLYSKSYAKSKKIVKAANNLNVKRHSLLKKERVDDYYQFATDLRRLFEQSNHNNDTFMTEIIQFSSDLTNYINNTTGVLGYAFHTYPNMPALVAHTLGVAIVAGKVAQLLKMDQKEVVGVVFTAVLHDIGLSNLVPGGNINQDIPKTVQEKEMNNHVFKAMVLLKDKKIIKKDILLGVLQHHERMDGSGYPSGTKGKDISQYARIIGFANQVDILMHSKDKSGNKLKISDFVTQIPFLADKYDPEICKVFQEYLEGFLLVNQVVLSDGQQAEIIYRHRAFKQPVVLTAKGEIIDLNKSSLTISGYNL